MALAGLLAINAVAEAVLLGEQRGGLAGLGNGVFNCVALLSTGLMVILDRGRVDATELLLAYFLGAMSAQACYVIGDANQRRTDRRRAMAFHWTRGQGKAIHQGELHYSWVAFVLMLVAFGYYRADILVLAVIASSRQVGEYAVAYRVFEVTLVLLQLLSLAAQPGMVRASYDGAEASHIRQVSAGLLVSGGVCACLLVLVGPVLLRFAFGAQYVSAAGLIPLFALGAVGQAISLASNGLLLGSLDATRKSVSLVLLNAVCVLLGAAGVVVGYEMGALRGVAFLQALTEISVGLLLCLVIFGRRSIPVGRMLMGWAAFAGGGAATVFLAPGIVSRLAAGVVLSGIAGWAVWRRAELVSWIHSW
jgi:O-antigen/teichoic acid export membrane protein